MEHRSGTILEEGLDEIRRSPQDGGRVVLIIRRPAVDERERLQEAVLDPVGGLVGDTWQTRGSRSRPDGSPHPDRQITLMNARAAALFAVDDDRRELAGDQLYVDFDLGEVNLPPGTQLALGSAVLEITAEPHLGCAKFAARFGRDALEFVNSPTGRELRLRGANARVVTGGVVRVGDVIRKLPAS